MKTRITGLPYAAEIAESMLRRQQAAAIVAAHRRKQPLLRMPQEPYDVYEAWAADELRSVNAQTEAVPVDAARRARRLRRPPPPTESGQP